jgi:GntR family transcriptional regulator
VEDEVLYKKRGLGMFVTEAAQAIILTKRREHTLKRLVSELVLEAEQLNVGIEELLEMVSTESKQSKGE